jgi:aspartokinase-like uncharacterized kinase
MRQPLADSQRLTSAAGGQRRIVKVGGSLLDWPLLKDKLVAWLASQSPARNVLLAGGGDLTDAIRRAQAIHQFGDQDAHWMCVRALSVTAQMLSRILPDAMLATSLDELPAADSLEASVLVFDPSGWLRQEEPGAPGQQLPHDWTATTDSIAARLATLTTASELVLLKSADPPPAASLAELAAVGYVDQHFFAAAMGLPLVRLVNFRSELGCDILFRC